MPTVARPVITAFFVSRLVFHYLLKANKLRQFKVVSWFRDFHFDFLGTAGFLHLTQNKGYWYQAHGMAEPAVGESSWDTQQFAGQRDFTRAVADWLDGGPEHLNRFAVGAAVVGALFGAYKSALLGRRVALPATLSDDEWQELMGRVRRAE